MAQGEAEHGCAQGEACRRGHPTSRSRPRTHVGRASCTTRASRPPARAAERAEDEPAVPPSTRAAEPAHLPADEPSPERGPVAATWRAGRALTATARYARSIAGRKPGAAAEPLVLGGCGSTPEPRPR